jgi:hypothetical protein
MDPLITVAMTIASGPGTYALLLGSGVSRSSGIRTGYEIILDLISAVAGMQNEAVGEDPLAWFKSTFGMEATYSTILEQLAGSNADRSALLKQYFEPEAGQPTHIPQAGHHAIAELVKAGIIRLIITTNFDRLLERALEEHGVSPTIVSTEDDATGALPIQHTPCYILKLHGDYKDIRTRKQLMN